MAFPKIAIVGAGALSTKQIYPNIGAAGGQIVGVCDLDREKATANAVRWGGEVFIDLEKMIETVKPDGVVICIGPEMHAKLALQVLNKGIPVYTEKPPALTAADALVVARKAEKTGILSMTAFKKRYAACYQRARDFIGQFSSDDRMSLSIDYASGHYDSGRGLFDFSIHCIDLAMFLFGDVKKVFAFTKGGHAYAVSLEFNCGAVGSLSFSDGRSFTIPTEEVEITLVGGNGMTIRNSSRWRLIENGKCTEWREPSMFTSSGDLGMETGHRAELIAFVDALKGSSTSVVSPIITSYRSMVLYEGIVESAKSGEVVSLTYEI